MCQRIKQALSRIRPCHTFTLFVCSWLFVSLSLMTQSHADDNQLSDYFIETWTSASGLPHNSINAIEQTTDGYLWFATWEGIARYNGLEFVLFDRGPKTRMQDSGTRALAVGPKNELYAGGARGSVVMRQGFSWHALPTAPSLVNDILRDADGGLWLAIEGMGVVYYSAEQLQMPTPQPTHFIETISSYRLALAPNKHIYAATEKGVYLLSAQQGATPISHHNLFEKVFYVATANDGALLVGSEHGAWRYQQQRWTPLDGALLNQAVTLVEQDSQGAYWFGTLSRGVAHLSDGELDFLDNHRGLPNNRILSWFEDSEGSIWIGTNGGVMRLRYAPFVTLTADQGLAGNYVRTVLAGQDHHVWVGASEGLSQIDTQHGSARILTDNVSVLSLAHRRQGGLWVGTYQHGLQIWQNGTLHTPRGINGHLPDDEVRAILERPDNTLWVGTPRGLAKLNQGTLAQLYDSQNSDMPGSYVMALASDEEGKVWVGTGRGVSYIEAGQLHTLDLSQQEQAQYVFGFYIEPGFVWMATDRGVIRYSQTDGSLALVGRPQGLPIDKFFQIIKDDSDNFWLSSNRGIWRINYQQAHQVADGTRQRIDFEHYDQSDGMANNQANGGSSPAATITPNGTLLFATAKGVASVSPDRIARLLSRPLPIVMQQVQFDGKDINPEANDIAPAGTNRVLFSYAALGYSMPEQIQYRTQLEGFELDWAYRHESHDAEYTNLSPGVYTFKVSARYPYGEWSDDVLRYQFTLEPSLWQRSDIRALGFFLFVSAAYGIFLWRIQRLQQKQLQLKALVKEKTQALQAQADDFERLSKEDPLTGLANRRAFDEYWHHAFDQARESGEPLQVAILDIDHFKRINDHYSHLVGDLIIQRVGAFLNQEQKHLRHVARWGGEEFTLLFAGSVADGFSYFDHLRRQIAALDLSDIDTTLSITVSIGMAGNQQASDYVDGLKRADQALYKAKRDGRNCVRQSKSEPVAR
ncbi:hypothetical protein BGK46_02435 [Salinivibrio sp. SS2]|nr:hypothetical protein BGK46_02435 [Salinivibrio sp. DV]